MNKNKYIIWLIIVSIIAFAYFVFTRYFSDYEITKDQRVELIYSLMLVTFLVFSLFSRKISFLYTMKTVLCWIGIFVIVLIGYSYKSSIISVYENVIASVNPSEARNSNDGTVEIKKSIGGQYKVNALINGKKIKFLVDTGASSVTLSQEDAARLGVDISSLNYNVIMYTANGVNKAAFVMLPYIQIGDIFIPNVKALVAQKGLDSSLLGMSFLDRLHSFSFNNDKLILRG